MGNRSDTHTSGTLLLVGAEPALAAELTRSGFRVQCAVDVPAALALVGWVRPDLVLADPHPQGITLLKRLMGIPVIFLSDRAEPADRIAGLAAGAADYLPRSCELAELDARIRAVLRRTRRIERRLIVGDLELDAEAHEVRRGGRPISLSPTEFNLLRYFMTNPEQVLSRQQILRQVWQLDAEGEAGVLESYVSYLRRKLDGDGPRLLHTVRGIGYALKVPVG
ncbi:DNA-binding response regulator [Pseudonocardiaceae bacterium YIM PH 21723]|nr:DNA-binding response regulator [Pseudonocardiaceae bacterium YIM PH 21723]